MPRSKIIKLMCTRKVWSLKIDLLDWVGKNLKYYNI